MHGGARWVATVKGGWGWGGNRAGRGVEGDAASHTHSVHTVVTSRCVSSVPPTHPSREGPRCDTVVGLCYLEAGVFSTTSLDSQMSPLQMHVKDLGEKGTISHMDSRWWQIHTHTYTRQNEFRGGKAMKHSVDLARLEPQWYFSRVTSVSGPQIWLRLVLYKPTVTSLETCTVTSLVLHYTTVIKEKACQNFTCSAHSVILLPNDPLHFQSLYITNHFHRCHAIVNHISKIIHKALHFKKLDTLVTILQRFQLQK